MQSFRPLIFLTAYLKSMRLYYNFVTGASGFAGLLAAFALLHGRSASGDTAHWTPGATLILLISFFSWGINQIINDYYDREEDRINAPRRPMVTGELQAGKAFFLSSVLMTAAAIFSLSLSTVTILPIALGFLFNLLYGKSKGVAGLGNFFYACSITMCMFYAESAMLGSAVFQPEVLTPMLLLSLPMLFSHFLMCVYSTVKDRTGDAAAGKRSIAVLIGTQWTTRLCNALTLLFLLAALLPFFRSSGGILPDGESVFTETQRSWIGYLFCWGICAFAGIRNCRCFTKVASNESESEFRNESEREKIRMLVHASTRSNAESCVAQIFLLAALPCVSGTLMPFYGIALLMLLSLGVMEGLFRFCYDDPEE